MSKEFSSNVEDKRLDTEEYIVDSIKKPFIAPVQIWRDADLIPKEAFSIENVEPTEIVVNEKTFKYYLNFSTKINDVSTDIIYFYEKMPLFIVPGTNNVYSCQNYLQDIVSPYFGQSYIYKLYIDEKELPFGRGNPEFDTESGIVKIQDEKINELINDNLYISFYKYVGRKGYENVESLPFSDDLIHFKQTGNNGNTASFLVRGKNHIKYILAEDVFYDNSEIMDSKVLVTQESIEDVIKHGVVIDGGKW